MPRVITELCDNAGACVQVCPVDCIVPGPPDSGWPWHFIDPDICIDCAACQAECPQGAIFTEFELPEAYVMEPGQKRISFASGETLVAEGGEVVDLTEAAEINLRFFTEGPGYEALEM